jgi:hypothetical protein
MPLHSFSAYPARDELRRLNEEIVAAQEVRDEAQERFDRGFSRVEDVS